MLATFYGRGPMSTDQIYQNPFHPPVGGGPVRGALLLHNEAVPGSMTGFQFVRRLNESDYGRYKRAFEVIYEVRHSNMFTYVGVAAEDLTNAALREGQEFGEDPAPRDAERVARVGARLRSKVLTLCASINQHQEQILAEVERRFGKNSSQWSKVRAEFNQLFDNSFGYRYLYKLRNTMIHYTMMAVSLKLYANKSGGAVDLMLDRSALLEDKKRLNAQQRQELESLDEDPSIFDLAMDALQYMAEVNPRILLLSNPELHLACKDLLEFDQIFESMDGTRCLLSGVEFTSEGRLRHVNHQMVSPEMVAFAKKHLESAAPAAEAEATQTVDTSFPT